MPEFICIIVYVPLAALFYAVVPTPDIDFITIHLAAKLLYLMESLAFVFVFDSNGMLGVQLCCLFVGFG